jgi:hypothetical protein
MTVHVAKLFYTKCCGGLQRSRGAPLPPSDVGNGPLDVDSSVFDERKVERVQRNNDDAYDLYSMLDS